MLGSCPALAAYLDGGESRSVVHSWQWRAGIPQAAARAQTSLHSCQTQPLGPAKHFPGSLDQLEAWQWTVLSPSTMPMHAVRSKGGPCGAQQGQEGLFLVEMRAKNCPGEPQAVIVPCPAADLLQEEGREEEL